MPSMLIQSVLLELFSFSICKVNLKLTGHSLPKTLQTEEEGRACEAPTDVDRTQLENSLLPGPDELL